MYIYISHINIYMYVICDFYIPHIYVCVYIFGVYVYIYLSYIFVKICKNIFIFTSIYTHICVHMCIYIHIYINTYIPQTRVCVCVFISVRL